MKFTPTTIDGLWVVDPEPRKDDRGQFARVFCERELASIGVQFRPLQLNESITLRRGTLRGMHYQMPPHAETKLVRCTRGAVFDVAVDLRAGSPTLGKWFGTRLESATGRQLLVPRGFAHGFMALEDDSHLQYVVDAFYEPSAERGIRWSDPRVGIEWPMAPLLVTPRDESHPSFSDTTAINMDGEQP